MELRLPPPPRRTAEDRPRVWARAGSPCGRGGDRALAIDCPDENRFVFVADVAGRGRGAERPADFLADAARLLVCQGMGVATALETLSLAFGHYFGGRFASAFLACICDDGTVAWASAGHPDALIVRAEGEHEHLGASGPLLGVFRDPSYRESSSALHDGDLLVVTTDGVSDALLDDGTRIGERGVARCAHAVRDAARDPAGAFVYHLFGAMRARLDDDWAVLAARRAG